MMKKCLLGLMAILFTVSSNAAVPTFIKEFAGWFESAYVMWDKTEGYDYDVYIAPASTDSWTKLDNELVREYPTYGRADALGLKAGSYQFKVVAKAGGAEQGSGVTDAFEVKAHDRSGFARTMVR